MDDPIQMTPPPIAEHPSIGTGPLPGFGGRRRWIGLALVGLSFLIYGMLLVVPVLSLSLDGKALLSVTIVVAGEAAFWLGAIILGREARSLLGFLRRLRRPPGRP
ncbi:MAG: transporter suffix domain-containing protein [Methanotrichaceae archaeon]|nr:transporter suffix domain-containing protein [Methanotrichaceae archaeon]